MLDIYSIFQLLIKKIASDPSSLDEENAELLELVMTESSKTSRFNATINESGNLVVKYSDNTVRELGNVIDTSGVQPDTTMSIAVINSNTIAVRNSSGNRALMTANDDGTVTITYFNAGQ